MTNLANAETQQIKKQIETLRHKAESGEQFAEICYLETLFSSGPWFNGKTQAGEVDAWRAA